MRIHLFVGVRLAAVPPPDAATGGDVAGGAGGAGSSRGGKRARPSVSRGYRASRG